ncbi:MAG: hypothetical protein IJ816_01745 [Alloprevotella sp.]|nr:hypothetical protein [Alloprevotella sp.]
MGFTTNSLRRNGLSHRKSQRLFRRADFYATTILPHLCRTKRKLSPGRWCSGGS